MTSSVAPYEQLVRQVEALKAENSHLRQELRDNSSHLSKLETETSGMKVRVGLGEAVAGTNTRALDPEAGRPGWGVSWRGGPGSPGRPADAGGALPRPPQEVLKHLQAKLEQEAGVLVSLGQTEVLEQLKGEGPAWGPSAPWGSLQLAPEGAGRRRGRRGH